MANLATTRSADPDVRRLAFDIASTQTNQVGPDAGLADAVGPAADQRRRHGLDGRRGDGRHHMSDMDAADGALMPGMATEDELAAAAVAVAAPPST